MPRCAIGSRPLIVSFEDHEVEIFITSDDRGVSIALSYVQDDGSYSQRECVNHAGDPVLRLEKNPPRLKMVTKSVIKNRVEMVSSLATEKVPHGVTMAEIDQITRDRFVLVASDGVPGRWLGVFGTMEEATDWASKRDITPKFIA
jgi:hypothetical protein